MCSVCACMCACVRVHVCVCNIVYVTYNLCIKYILGRDGGKLVSDVLR